MSLANSKYGLTVAGLKIKPFEVIAKEIGDELITKLGPIDLNPRSVFSTLINIFAEREVLIWQLAEETYSAMYPDSAEGLSLDNVCALNGLIRSIATKSYVLAQITAINHTIIPQGSEIRVENTRNVLSLYQEIVVSNNSCSSILIEVQDATLTKYTVTVNSTEYSYTRGQNDTIMTIADKLKTELAKNSELNIEIISNGSSIRITSKEMTKSFSCFISEGVAIIDLTSNAYFFAREVGKVVIPVGSASVIETPVSGWISVSNATAGILGRDTETDIELRDRREVSLRLSGSGTIEALKARLLNINNVTYVEVVDNRTNEVVDDLPPKSFKVTVVGGEDQVIGQMIWQVQPIGIESVGSTSVVVKDSANKDQIVKFSRPTSISAFVNIVLTVNELFIDDSISAIKQAIVTRVRNLKLGEQLILQSLYSDIYSVAGIKNAVITMGKNSDSLSNADITINASEIISIETVNINISKSS